MMKTLKHWLKVDHITFLLMLPFIILINGIFWLSISKLMAIILWMIAFAYDYCEHEMDNKKDKGTYEFTPQGLTNNCNNKSTS